MKYAYTRVFRVVTYTFNTYGPCADLHSVRVPTFWPTARGSADHCIVEEVSPRTD